MANTYRDLLAWQRSMDLVCAVYAATQRFPKAELFGLTSQMRRAASSVPSNIAEGNGRRTLPDQRRCYLIARGSLQELDTQLEIAARLRLLTRDESTAIEASITYVVRLINGLIRRIDERVKT